MKNKIRRVLALVLVLALIAPVLLAVSASAAGTGFLLDSSTNTKFEEYWSGVDIYALFNSVDSGFLLTGWSTVSKYYVGLVVGYLDTISSDYPIIKVSPKGYGTQGVLGDFTHANYPLGEIDTALGATPGSSGTAIFRNYAEAYDYYSRTGAAVYFLTPYSRVAPPSVSTSSKSKYVCALSDLGHISSTGVLSYGKSLDVYQSNYSTSGYFYGAYYLPEYPAASDVSLLPDNYTVASGVAKALPYWLSTNDGQYLDPSIAWSITVYDSWGTVVSADWVRMDSDSGLLSLTPDCPDGYDVQVTATWGDGISKSTMLYVRDLSESGGTDTGTDGGVSGDGYMDFDEPASVPVVRDSFSGQAIHINEDETWNLFYSFTANGIPFIDLYGYNASTSTWELVQGTLNFHYSDDEKCFFGAYTYTPDADAAPYFKLFRLTVTNITNVSTEVATTDMCILNVHSSGEDLGGSGGAGDSGSSGDNSETLGKLEELQTDIQEVQDAVSSVSDKVDDLSEQIDNSFDQMMNGDSGVDSSVTDFSGISDSLTASMGDVNNAIGSGVESLNGFVSSDAMVGTAAALGAVLGAAFTGFDISICGITGNPFELAVLVFGSMALIGLVLIYVFRKRGGS